MNVKVLKGSLKVLNFTWTIVREPCDILWSTNLQYSRSSLQYQSINVIHVLLLFFCFFFIFAQDYARTKEDPAKTWLNQESALDLKQTKCWTNIELKWHSAQEWTEHITRTITCNHSCTKPTLIKGLTALTVVHTSAVCDPHSPKGVARPESLISILYRELAWFLAIWFGFPRGTNKHVCLT